MVMVMVYIYIYISNHHFSIKAVDSQARLYPVVALWHFPKFGPLLTHSKDAFSPCF